MVVRKGQTWSMRGCQRDGRLHEGGQVEVSQFGIQGFVGGAGHTFVQQMATHHR